MTTNTAYLGIDISKEAIDVALYGNKNYKYAKFDNNKEGFRKLLQWLKKHKAKQCHACMEATGRYGELLAETLYQKGHPVSVVNPANIKRYGQSQLRRNKTDKLDAKLIAHYCATQEPHLWQPPAAHEREVQEMSRHLDALKGNLTREKNRLQSGLRSETVIDNVKETIVFLKQQIAELEEALRNHVNRHPDLKEKVDLLTSIPGIGETTAIGFLAEVPDISRFRSASQIAAFAGVTPFHNHSGQRVTSNGKLCKIGNRRLRTLFFMPQKSARRWNPIVKALVQRLEKAGKSNKVIRGAVMRKLIHLAYGVLKTGKSFDPNHPIINIQGAC